VTQQLTCILITNQLLNVALFARINSSLILHLFFFLMIRPPPKSTLFPYTTLFRSMMSTMITTVALRHFAGSMPRSPGPRSAARRSEEHTSELQSLAYLVCRLLLEKKKKIIITQEARLPTDCILFNRSITKYSCIVE